MPDTWQLQQVMAPLRIVLLFHILELRAQFGIQRCLCIMDSWYKHVGLRCRLESKQHIVGQVDLFFFPRLVIKYSKRSIAEFDGHGLRFL